MNRFDQLRKGPNMIQMAPVANFTSMWQVILFWIANIWLLFHICDLFHVPLLNIIWRMFL